MQQGIPGALLLRRTRSLRPPGPRRHRPDKGKDMGPVTLYVHVTKHPFSAESTQTLDSPPLLCPKPLELDVCPSIPGWDAWSSMLVGPWRGGRKQLCHSCLRRTSRGFENKHVYVMKGEGLGSVLGLLSLIPGLLGRALVSCLIAQLGAECCISCLF